MLTMPLGPTRTQVFWGVMERGGYETVTAEKLWKDICRCLPVDLTGQTSASFNMRANYERCLLDLENYLACGQVGGWFGGGGLL